MNILKTSLHHGLIGFGLFATWGAFKGIMQSRTPNNDDDDNGIDSYTQHINQNEFARVALEKLRGYRQYAPQEFRTIVENLDKLIGLQWLAQRRQIQADMPYKATRYYMNIEQALRKMEYLLRDVVTPHFESDKQELLRLAQNYRHNTNIDTNNFLMSSTKV